MFLSDVCSGMGPAQFSNRDFVHLSVPGWRALGRPEMDKAAGLPITDAAGRARVRLGGERYAGAAIAAIVRTAIGVDAELARQASVGVDAQRAGATSAERSAA